MKDEGLATDSAGQLATCNLQPGTKDILVFPQAPNNSLCLISSGEQDPAIPKYGE